MAHKVVTANRLLDGEVVYLSSDANWCRSLNGAEAKTCPSEQELLLQRGLLAEIRQEVVGAYLMEVRPCEHKGWQPTSQREAIRAQGPSILLSLHAEIRVS